MKKLNKKKMIDEYVERFGNYVLDNHGSISDAEYRKLMCEGRKVITKYIKSYPYENDGYEEYVDDYDVFDHDLLCSLKNGTSYLREHCCD